MFAQDGIPSIRCPTIHLHLEREEDKIQQLITRENIQEAIKAANLKFQKYYNDTEHPKGFTKSIMRNMNSQEK
ncbi:hypothetical protein CIHG_10151 [Coccidioides immitis H538.4]|uniref:Uncharacterized protein n=1 Tax=Coccidioides immitis H538.4 TaxID=396776 RepID=A0A0J8S4J1_COCIT|nr:hypothetical protein CIHG_10151 [Coccidioides immitis H538.4]